MQLGCLRRNPLHFARSPASPQVNKGSERLEKFIFLYVAPSPPPPLKCQRAGWLGAGALEAPESGSKGSFFGVQKLGPTRAKEARWGRGFAPCSGMHRADAPGSPAAGAHRYRSPTAVASRHDTAAATKRRPPPALGAPHRSPGHTPSGVGSGRWLWGCVEGGGGTRGQRKGESPEMRRKPGGHL